MDNSLSGFRSATALSTVAVIGLALTCGCETITGIAGIGEIIEPSLTINVGKAANSPWLIAQGFIGLFQILLYLATVIFFLVWLFRIYKNLDLLESGYREFTAGWAVGWWFVPFANLVKPFQVVREAWCESDPIIEQGPQFLSSSLDSAPPYIGLWWGFWIASNIFANLTNNLARFDTISNLQTTGVLFFLSSSSSIVAGLLCIKLVRDITERQNQRSNGMANLRSFEPPPPPTFATEAAV
jgi:hypothetical protein